QKEEVDAVVRLLRPAVGVGDDLFDGSNSKGAGRPAPFHQPNIRMRACGGPHTGGAGPAGGALLVPAHQGLGDEQRQGPLAAAGISLQHDGMGEPPGGKGAAQRLFDLAVSQKTGEIHQTFSNRSTLSTKMVEPPTV